MTKRPPTSLMALLLVIAFYVRPMSAQTGSDPTQSDELRTVAPNVFLDCSRRICDLDYIRTEITFVNYVSDRTNADVHILITRERTGSGGNEYTLAFIGRGIYRERDSTLKYYSKSTDTSDEVRKGMVNLIKQGLVPYMYDTPMSEFITVSYAGRSRPQTTQVQDPWNYWVFYTSLRGNLNYEERSKRYNTSISLSANRTTEDIKFRLWLNGNFDERRYQISDIEEVKSSSNRKTAYTQLIKSIGGHWSWGASASLYSSTYDNAELYTSIGPAVEFNIFPYSESTRRELRIQYRLYYTMRDYIETTIFAKDQENLFSHQLQAVFEMKEPWGSMGFQLEGSTFLHDFSKNHLTLESGLSVRVFRGLSLSVSGEFSRVRDQLSLPAEDASKDEILLQLKQLATSYDLRMQVGFSYRFGSIYSNVVNPRFGNL